MSRWRSPLLASFGWLASSAAALVVVLALEPALANLHFRHAWLLLALALVPALLLHAVVLGDAHRPRFSLPWLAPLLAGPRGWRPKLRHLPTVLRMSCLTLGVFALARPVDLSRGESVEESGIDIVVALDMSGSMRAVMDEGARVDKPGAAPRRRSDGMRPTRLEVAKSVLAEFIERRKDDRIGVVVFGPAAYVLSPPTLDHTMLLSLVGKLELNLVDAGGTAIGDALGTGVARLRRATGRSKVLLLLTDGDSNSGSVSPTTAADLAVSQAVVVHTIQIGDGSEAEVQEGTDILGNPRYVKANFPVNPELLQEIAKKTGGESFVASDRAAFERSMHTILDGLEKTRFVGARTTARELFMPLLLAAGLFFALEIAARALLLRRFP